MPRLERQNVLQQRGAEIPSIDWGAPYGTNLEMGSAPWHNAAEDYEPKVDVSYTIGKHAMKYGFSYNRYTKNQQLFGDANGKYTFSGNSRLPIHERWVYRTWRRDDGYVAGPRQQLRPAARATHPPLCEPNAIGLRDGQLARDSASVAAVGSPL